MRDSSCYYNESDSYCHPTLCGIKMTVADQHEVNLENAGYKDLANYAWYMDKACNKCEGCGYIDYKTMTQAQRDAHEDQEYKHPLDLVLPEPIESYREAMKTKEEVLKKDFAKATETLRKIREDFKETFGKEIDEESTEGDR